MKDPISEDQLLEAANLEETARGLFLDRKIEEAFQAYREAALLYRHAGQALKASSCFAHAAQCEKIRTGLEPLREAALMSDEAAIEAMKAGQFAQAKWLFREAGLLYEKEGEFEDYSRTFIAAQEAHLCFLWDMVCRGRKQNRIEKSESIVGLKERAESLFAWFMGKVSQFIWRYGEDPIRPVLVGILLILICGMIYKIAGPVKIDFLERNISFSEAFYMSSVTFTTVGFGDYVPLGWVRLVTILEAFSGIFLMPLFVIALTRRYLRVYR